MSGVGHSRIYCSLCRAIMVFIVLQMLVGMSISSASAQNPWFESNQPLIDEGNQPISERNSWSGAKGVQSADAIDESKYPPLEEDETLGTGFYSAPAEDLPAKSTPSSPAGESYKSYSQQSLGEIPVYPGTHQGGFQSQYGNRPYSGYNQGFQPGYPSGPWPGNNGMSGFPFGGNSSNGLPFGGNSYGNGFPFGGNSYGNGMPFGMGNGWMPNSGTGFW